MTVANNLLNVKGKIAALAVQSGRDPSKINLLAVSKKKSLTMIQEAYAKGQRAFGENYVQEAVDKIQQLMGLEIEWHMIGHVQDNKAKVVAKYFDWVHTVDSVSLAKKLSRYRPEMAGLLNVCVQVNISQEPQKSGVMLDEVSEICAEVSIQPHLRLRGLMAIGENTKDELQLKRAYERLFGTYQLLQSQDSSIDTLSLGMSNDMGIAIAAGSTMVRVGTAIFGDRAM